MGKIILPPLYWLFLLASAQCLRAQVWQVPPTLDYDSLAYVWPPPPPPPDAYRYWDSRWRYDGGDHFWALKNGLRGVIDSAGRVLLPPVFQEIEACGVLYSNHPAHWAAVYPSGYRDSKGKAIAGVIANHHGKIVHKVAPQPQIESAEALCDWYNRQQAPARDSAIKPTWWQLADRYHLAYRGDQEGLFSAKKRRMVLPPIYDNICEERIGDEKLIVAQRSDTFHIYNRALRLLWKTDGYHYYQSADCGYWVISPNTQRALYQLVDPRNGQTRTGWLQALQEIDPEKGFFLAQDTFEKWGIVDTSGRIRLPFEYEDLEKPKNGQGYFGYKKKQIEFISNDLRVLATLRDTSNAGSSDADHRLAFMGFRPDSGLVFLTNYADGFVLIDEDGALLSQQVFDGFVERYSYHLQPPPALNTLFLVSYHNNLERLWMYDMTTRQLERLPRTYETISDWDTRHGFTTSMPAPSNGLSVYDTSEESLSENPSLLGYVSWKGREVLPPICATIEESEELVAFSVRSYILLRPNRPILPLTGILWAGAYREGLCPFMDENGRFGYLDENGQIAIPARFEHAEPFADGQALVQTTDTIFQLIDKNGAILEAQLSPPAIQAFRQRTPSAPESEVKIEKRQLYGLRDLNGKNLIEPSLEFVNPLVFKYTNQRSPTTTRCGQQRFSPVRVGDKWGIFKWEK